MTISQQCDVAIDAEVEVLPPDVQTKVVALRHLDGAAQAAAVTVMLSHSRTGLLAAIAAQQLPEIVEWKAKGAAIQEIAKQLRLGKDMQLDAAEFVRRAERGLGVAIREGQAAGTILAPGKKNFHAGGYALAKKQLNDELIPGPTTYATGSELSGANDPGTGIYAMTDGVTEEQFDEAISEARQEGNLSRANVARKAKSKAVTASTRLSDDDKAHIDAADAAASQPTKKRLTKHDSTEMLANINGMLNGVVESISFMHAGDIDAQASRPIIENIRRSINKVRNLLKEIENG